jgi:radical SAM superfamily enzyme YgiQ (UPF0313 family)
MHVLLVYPVLPAHILQFRGSMARLGKKSSYPPMGLLTIAAMFPDNWQVRLVDCNVAGEVSETDWEWAELVMISAMLPQQHNFHAQVKLAKARGKSVAVGGPYPTALPEEAASSGADYMVLNEGEITVPMFLADLEAGATSGTYETEDKPDITLSPIPRFDLLDLTAYAALSVQFSRGCPFVCEFCDIITLYGRKARVKTTEQMLVELENIYQLGWRGVVSVIDDNFIANRRHAKVFLQALSVWMEQKNYPFVFITEASVDLARETDLLELMVDCNFKGVFLGIETPDEASLVMTKKKQNLRSPITESVASINKAGLSVIAGMIIGFDGEKKGAGQRIVDFMNETAIPITNFGILQALPTTALWDRLENQKRLLSKTGDGMSTKPMNFTPTRPACDIIEEYIDANWQLYGYKSYVDRVFEHCMRVTIINHGSIKKMGWQEFTFRLKKLDRRTFGFLVYLFWQQGVVLKTRGTFWRYLFKLGRKKPIAILPFLLNCGFFDDLDEHRQLVRKKLMPHTRII